MADAKHLERYLQDHIPLSNHLGLRVLAAAAEGVHVRAPLEPNLNHQQTAFGGSLSAVAILAGWGLLWVRLREVTSGHRIVIQSSSMTYLAPVRSDFDAVSRTPEGSEWNRFRRTLEQRGRARIQLAVRVTAGGEAVAEFQGTYVVLGPGFEN